MSDETPASEMTRKKVLYHLPDMAAVEVRPVLTYRETEGGALTFDLYMPPGASGEGSLAMVVLVGGYPDPGFRLGGPMLSGPMPIELVRARLTHQPLTRDYKSRWCFDESSPRPAPAAKAGERASPFSSPMHPTAVEHGRHACL